MDNIFFRSRANREPLRWSVWRSRYAIAHVRAWLLALVQDRLTFVDLGELVRMCLYKGAKTRLNISVAVTGKRVADGGRVTEKSVSFRPTFPPTALHQI